MKKMEYNKERKKREKKESSTINPVIILIHSFSPPTPR
jgi:hypothetical protein